MTSPELTTQLKCPNCGQTGILSERPDQESEITGAHSAGFFQEGTQAVCRLCSTIFPIENPN